jgi:hypothetical protein
MNGCLTDQELRSLLEGELMDAEMATMGDHLVECGRCRQRADDLSNVIELNWARGVRDQSSDSDAVVSQQLMNLPTLDKAVTNRSENLDLERELEWLEPPRQAGDLGTMSRRAGGSAEMPSV